WSGRLRQAATPLLPANRRLPRVLQRHLAGIIRERPREVVPRGPPPLPWRPLPHRWYTGRFARGRQRS
ncbi:hypothetical protein BN1708_019794, partial [Verticillium longisporum]